MPRPSNPTHTEWFPRIRVTPAQKARIDAGFQRYCERNPSATFAAFVREAIELQMRVDESDPELTAARAIKRSRKR